ncbi:hypothetical protein TNCV_630981 [Trichonephila clavipes]|nr:hypothetical protein TNCV_630981 [Trichonephila clavipes]
MTSNLFSFDRAEEECPRVQRYPTARELLIHEVLHYDNVKPVPIFAWTKLPPSENPILQDYRGENGEFDFPIAKPLRRRIAPVASLSKSTHRFENAPSSHSILPPNFKRSRTENEGRDIVNKKAKPSSRDSGNETDVSSTSESSKKINNKREEKFPLRIVKANDHN